MHEYCLFAHDIPSLYIFCLILSIIIGRWLQVLEMLWLEGFLSSFSTNSKYVYILGAIFYFTPSICTFA